MRLRPTHLAAFAAATLAALAAAAPARADVKIVQERTLTGLAELDAYSVPRTIIYYYKGDKFREEQKGGNIVFLYDCAQDKFYTINRADQTYSVRRLDEALTAKRGLLSGLTVDGNAEVTEGGSTKTISGKKAKDYALSMNVRLRSERTGGTVLTVKMEGQQWTGVDLPMSAKCQRILKASYARGIFRYNKLLEPLYAKVDKIQGLPLGYDMILNLSALSPVEGVTGGTIEAHADVKSISTATLPDSLFTVPKGYRLVDVISADDAI